MAEKTSLFDLVVPEAMAAYYEKMRSNDVPMFGLTCFPNKSKTGLRLDFIKGYDSLPVMLTPSAFDAKPTIRAREGIELESTKMPFFRESMHITEEDRQNLLMFSEMNNGNSYASEIIRRIFDDTKALIDGANIVPEVMRMGLLTAGQFSIGTTDTNRAMTATYTYNYDPDGTWAASNVVQVTSTDTWDKTETANPVQDIIDVKRKAAAKGVNLTRMVVSPQTWGYLIENQIIKKNMFLIGNLVTQATPTVVNDMMVKNYIKNATGVTVIVYDKQYKDYEGAEKSFYPDKFATLLPDSAVGSTWYGTTPEAADLRSGKVDAEVKILDSGIALCTKKESLPVNIITWVSEIVLPSFENMNRVYNIKW